MIQTKCVNSHSRSSPRCHQIGMSVQLPSSSPLTSGIYCWLATSPLRSLLVIERVRGRPRVGSSNGGWAPSYSKVFFEFRVQLGIALADSPCHPFRHNEVTRAKRLPSLAGTDASLSETVK